MGFLVDYCSVNAIVTQVKVPISNSIKITDPIQPATDKYSAVIDLSNMFSVYFNSFSDIICLHLLRNTIISAYLATHRLPPHLIEHSSSLQAQS